MLASGRGGNLQAIIKAVKAGKIKAHLKLVISDKENARMPSNMPAKHGSQRFTFDPKDFKDRESIRQAIVERLHEQKIDFVVLAGYMRLLISFFIEQYPNKILNIHPSLLPSFKGAHAIRDAFNFGAKVTGPTVHFIDDKMDEGMIILQEPVPIDPEDTLESLEEKIHQAEHRIYPQAIDLFVRGCLKIEGKKVTVL